MKNAKQHAHTRDTRRPAQPTSTAGADSTRRNATTVQNPLHYRDSREEDNDEAKQISN